MLFNSLHFVIFFPCVVLAYFFLPFRFRWIWLLVSSYYFYMVWNPVYALVIVLLTTIDYFAGLRMGAAQDKRQRKKYLLGSIAANLGLLFTFKYFNFFNASLKTVFDWFGWSYQVPGFHLLLPLGISFHTFQALSYTIEVYRGNKEPERHFGKFALFIVFFPQLVAGPIERSTSLLPQIHERHSFDYDRVVNGLKLMFWGFFKKIVIADRLADVVNTVYNNPHDYSGLSLIAATYFFAFQIYCDFSGYSDIAIGAAEVMGFKLMENFRQPYLSQSIAEFWRRWHISLSTWFRDYLYFPLGGNRVATGRWVFNIMTVFLISGLWHGANGTFVIWGGLHGIYMLGSRWTQDLRDRVAAALGLERVPGLRGFLRTVITFHLVSFAWIFFRANTIDDAFYIVRNLFVNVQTNSKEIGLDSLEFSLVITLIIFLFAMDWRQTKGSIRAVLARQPFFLRWALYTAGSCALIALGVFTSNKFIYFQF